MLTHGYCSLLCLKSSVVFCWLHAVFCQSYLGIVSRMLTGESRVKTVRVLLVLVSVPLVWALFRATALLGPGAGIPAAAESSG